MSTPKDVFSFDSRCLNLAEIFLASEDGVMPDDERRLAQAIQDAIENWIYDWNEDKKQPPEQGGSP